MKMWILSLSLMAFAPATFAGIKELQGSLIKNKNSIDNLLALKAHSIPNEAYAHPLASVARQMTLDASRNNNTRDDVFVGPEALAKLIKSSSVQRLEGREGEERKGKKKGPTEVGPFFIFSSFCVP